MGETGVKANGNNKESTTNAPYDNSSSLTQSSNTNVPGPKLEEENTEPELFTGEDLEKTGEGEPMGDGELIRLESSAQASRTISRRITGSDRLMEKANDTDEPLPTMGGGRDYPPMLGSRDPYMVEFDGPDDPTHPYNWTLFKKVHTSLIVALGALAVSLGSAMFSEASEVVMEKYHVGATTATLGTSLFVFGFASGPVIWGPLSELYGRKFVLIPSAFGYVCFSFGVAAAKDLQTIMLCRFFAGCVGAAPLVVAPAAMADMFDANVRGSAMALFAMVLFGGPMLAPIFGGFTVKNDALGWRWTSYLSALVGVLPLITTIIFFDETHHSLILVKKAEVLRRRTGNWGIQAPHEEVSLSLREIAEKNIARPIIMLFTEPILFLITLYNAFIYGILYLCLTAVPLIFTGKYYWVQGKGELPYLSMLIGTLFGGILCILFEKRYVAKMNANGGKPVPEERLPPMMIGGFFFAAGLFWLGWGGDFGDKVHWIVPTLGLLFVGLGLIAIFLPCINYIIDCYLLFAASALAGNTFLRSLFGGIFPLFARQMFTKMKIKYALTLLGCVAVVLIPVPFLFYRYGQAIRSRSKYAFA